jgi:hypothetical protein
MHRSGERTQGTETSKYLEEKKAICDSVSSGERTRRSPNRWYVKVAPVVPSGSWDGIWCVCKHAGELQSGFLGEHVWISQAIEGDSPVTERKQPPLCCSQVVRATWNPVRIQEAHLLRLNTTR